MDDVLRLTKVRSCRSHLLKLLRFQWRKHPMHTKKKTVQLLAMKAATTIFLSSWHCLWKWLSSRSGIFALNCCSVWLLVSGFWHDLAYSPLSQRSLSFEDVFASDCAFRGRVSFLECVLPDRFSWIGLYNQGRPPFLHTWLLKSFIFNCCWIIKKAAWKQKVSSSIVNYALRFCMQ